MTELDGIQDISWLFSTHEQHPTQAEEAFAILNGFGEQVIDGLTWALSQDDVDLKRLCLQLSQNFYPDAMKALPAVRAFISDDKDRLVRVTAINTVHVMGDSSDELIPLLKPRLKSEDDFERILPAANLFRVCRCEDARW